MPGKDHPASAPEARPGQNRGGSAVDLSRGSGPSGADQPLSGSRPDGLRGGTAALGQDRSGRNALGKQTIGGAVDQHDADTRGRPFQPPAILRAPSSLLSRPLFLHPVPQLSAPFRSPSLPPFVPAPLLFAPPIGPPRPAIPPESTAPQNTPEPTQPPAEVLPKVELSVTSSAIDTAPTSAETPSSSGTLSFAVPSTPSPDSAIASTTSDPAPDIVPLAFSTSEPVAASLVDTSSASPDTLPVTNTGGKVAAACVIGAVFLLLLNWAFWLVIRRRRRARRSMPAHWDFAAPQRAKGDVGRESEEDERDAERDVKGGMGAVPV